MLTNTLLALADMEREDHGSILALRRHNDDPTLWVAELRASDGEPVVEGWGPGPELALADLEAKFMPGPYTPTEPKE